MSADGLTASIEKMRREGAGDAAVETFAYYYRRLRDGDTGVLAEAEIEPVAEAPHADDLPDAGEEGRAALDRAVVLKLNGGPGHEHGDDAREVAAARSRTA